MVIPPPPPLGREEFERLCESFFDTHGRMPTGKELLALDKPFMRWRDENRRYLMGLYRMGLWFAGALLAVAVILVVAARIFGWVQP